MSIKSLVTAGFLTASLIALAGPAQAQPGRDDRGAHGDHRGNGGNGGNWRGGANGGGRQQASPSPAPAPAPTVRVAPPTAAPTTPKRWPSQRNEGQNWNGQRGVRPAPPQPPREAAAQPQGRSSSSWQTEGRNRDGNAFRDDDRRGRDGAWRGNEARDGDRIRDRDRDRDRDWNRNNNRNDSRNWNGNRNDTRNWNDNRGNWNRPGVRPPVVNRWNGIRRWDNNGWRNDRRYDWQSWRRVHRDVYHLPAYYPPYGWTRGYFGFSIGAYIDDLLFTSTYWIDDPWAYRLPPAYGPLRWVRYYDDALLVDIRDGYVVDVIHDVFW